MDSAETRAAAANLFPGRVNSPVRSFRSVGGEPIVLERGAGGRVWDADGREYVDLLGAFGPLLLGHAHPDVVAAIRETAGLGTAFGALTPGEVSMGRLITDATGLERLRFVTSGTEATMTAIREESGALVGVVGVVVDLSGRRAVEDELRQRSEDAATAREMLTELSGEDRELMREEALAADQELASV